MKAHILSLSLFDLPSDDDDDDSTSDGIDGGDEERWKGSSSSTELSTEREKEITVKERRGTVWVSVCLVAATTAVIFCRQQQSGDWELYCSRVSQCLLHHY